MEAASAISRMRFDAILLRSLKIRDHFRRHQSSRPAAQIASTHGFPVISRHWCAMS